MTREEYAERCFADYISNYDDYERSDDFDETED